MQEYELLSTKWHGCPRNFKLLSFQFNKLGLDEAKGWFFSGEVENSLIPKR